MIRFRKPLPSSGSSAVMKKIGMLSSMPRTISRNTNPSISPIIISVMMALNCLYPPSLSKTTASGVEATQTAV